METETAAPRTTSSVKIHGKEFQALPEPADYWGWIVEGRYDHEWKVYDAYLKPQHAFIDLGAWVGAHSMYASRTARSIHAVEPDPVAHEVLLKNLAPLDPRPETHLYRCALGKDAREVTLGSGMLGASTTRENLAAGGGIGEATETFTVQSLSLFTLCLPIRDPLFIKIDIEGSEEEIFKDFRFFANRKPTMLVELHPFWWKDEKQTWKDFEAVRSLYRANFEVPHPNSRTWVLAND